MAGKNRRWKHWCIGESLYIKSYQGWQKHNVVSRSRLKIIYSQESEDINGKPSGGSPITDLWMCEHQMESTLPTEEIQKKQTTTKVHKTFRSYTQTLEPWEQ
eukprot:3414202-Ditylum_brightwellii.AAC.1